MSENWVFRANEALGAIIELISPKKRQGNINQKEKEERGHYDGPENRGR